MTVLAVLLWSMTMPRAGAIAGVDSARLEAKASVRAWVKLRVSQRVATYTVTEDDLVRGYIDVGEAATVHLRSNENRSYRLSLPNAGARRILLRATGHARAFRHCLDLAHPVPGRLVEKSVDCRVILPADTAPGLYSLPFAFTLASL